MGQDGFHTWQGAKNSSPRMKSPGGSFAVPSKKTTARWARSPVISIGWPIPPLKKEWNSLVIHAYIRPFTRPPKQTKPRHPNTSWGERCFSSIFWGSPVIPNLSFGAPGDNFFGESIWTKRRQIWVTWVCKQQTVVTDLFQTKKTRLIQRLFWKNL